MGLEVLHSTPIHQYFKPIPNPIEQLRYIQIHRVFLPVLDVPPACSVHYKGGFLPDVIQLLLNLCYILTLGNPFKSHEEFSSVQLMLLLFSTYEHNVF